MLLVVLRTQPEDCRSVLHLHSVWRTEETHKGNALGYKYFFMPNSTEHEIYPADNVKMPTIVGI